MPPEKYPGLSAGSGLCKSEEQQNKRHDGVFLLLFFIWALPRPSRLTAQAAYRTKIFRGIFQKCSPSHQGLPALFGSFRKKFPARSTT
ncbi:hypothetical protein [Gemmiger sp. An50]|uniref:hypothetical protein n=1 Tax=Gemmiger sp. An50 TaxID=1965639 RepID=UPI00111EABC9|nr:hypothetical protein [Gemmiger sp. An50]